jgi:glycogen debranching enzyme
MGESARQPYLHDRVVCLAAPAVWLSAPSGQIATGADGVYVADRRALSRLELTVDGEPPVPVSGGLASASEARFVAVVRGLGDPSPDPTVSCARHRHVTSHGGVETITLRNSSRVRIVARVAVVAESDLAAIGEVKAGARCRPASPSRTGTGLTWASDSGDHRVSLDCEPPPHRHEPLSWDVALDPGESFTTSLTVTASGREQPGYRPLPAAGPPPWTRNPFRVRAADRRLDELVRQSVADLGALLLGDPADPRDVYCGAGAPWYLTLFGRDSLWAARMALPLGTELAAGTLRTLARRQGTRLDAETGEAPGKIPHELRSGDAAVGLPEVYYGTIDATPLFVAALAEAWRWGMPEADVAALLPAAERSLDWLVTLGDPDGDGFVEYAADHAGLSNQGWKDSHDGVQWADGRLADAPLALCEVQGYAYQAALAGAALLDRFSRPGGQRWRDWAAGLAKRFRESFWVSDADGPYPAVALDATKRPVDSPTSNIGHLLGTGLLTAEESALVARRLSAPSFDSGYGLRTLGDTARGFNPLSYHAGSVWPHDTAIAAWGLARAGRYAEASRLIGGLLAAAPYFGYRLPELYAGDRRTGRLPPVPYPAACRPQAWAAAAGPLIVRTLLGLEVDAPAGRIRLRPLAPSPVGEYQVTGVRVAGGLLGVRVDAQGRAELLESPPGVDVALTSP